MFKYALPAILLLACLSNCKEKETPVIQNGNPVFSVSGMADDTRLILSGGVNRYYMLTDYLKAPNSLYIFSGELKRDDCTSCGPSLKISIRNYTLAPSFNMDSAITVGKYSFYNQQKPVETNYTLSCYAQASGLTGTPTYAWNFGNNRFSTEQNPVVTFPVSGVYSVACTALFPGGCFSDLTQPIYLTPERVGKSADFTINYTDSFTVLLNGIPVNPSATVKWDLGDGNTTTGTIIKHSYVSGGIYKVCMEYINGKDTQQFCKNVNTLNVNKCKVNYSYITERIVDSLHLSHVVVEWRDAEGNLYSSGKMDQPQTSEFKVLDVEEYALNESGQKTRKLTVQFSCWVSNGFRNIELKNVSGTFAIAHP